MTDRNTLVVNALHRSSELDMLEDQIERNMLAETIERGDVLLVDRKDIEALRVPATALTDNTAAVDRILKGAAVAAVLVVLLLLFGIPSDAIGGC